MPLFLISLRLLLLLPLISLIHSLPTKYQRNQHKIVKRFGSHSKFFYSEFFLFSSTSQSTLATMPPNLGLSWPIWTISHGWAVRPGKVLANFREPRSQKPIPPFGPFRRVIADAMHHWERAGRNLLRLTDLSPATRSSLLNSRRVADIDIFFAGFAHGDAEAFDGRGGLVAHSAYPPLGIVHFDASELWVLHGKRKEEEEDKVADDQQQQPFLDLRINN